MRKQRYVVTFEQRPEGNTNVSTLLPGEGTVRPGAVRCRGRDMRIERHGPTVWDLVAPRDSAFSLKTWQHLIQMLPLQVRKEAQGQEVWGRAPEN